MKISPLRVNLFFAASTLLFGCGSSGVSSGVDGSKLGEDLSNEETVKVCQAIVNYGAQAFTVADACKTRGVANGVAAYLLQASDETIRSSCNDGVTACTEENDEGSDPGDTCADVETDPSCRATVAEAETCATERIDAFAARVDEIPSCSQLSRAYFEDNEGGSGGNEPDRSTACKNVDEMCPSAALVIAGSIFQ